MIAKTMNDMKAGEKAKVHKLDATGTIRRRLIDIGLIEGTKVECLQKSLFGDPTAFLIRGAVIAVRSEESKNIQII